VCHSGLTGNIQELLQEFVSDDNSVVEVEDSELTTIKRHFTPIRQHLAKDLGASCFSNVVKCKGDNNCSMKLGGGEAPGHLE
jgi:hypothetical protein